METQPNITYVTGADDRFFAMTLCLLHSFRRWCPNQTLWVCDFGLSRGNKRFFTNEGILLERPPDVALEKDPFYFKVNIDKYLGDKQIDNTVWIDSDCLIFGPLHDALSLCVNKYRQLGFEIALCRDSGVDSIGHFLEKYHAPPFQTKIVEENLSTEAPYFNAGFFVLMSPHKVQEWRREAYEIERHPVFEQNVLNLLIQRGNLKAVELPGNLFNLHDEKLMDLSVVDGENETRIAYRESRPILVHFTANKPGILEERNFSLTANTFEWSGYFRPLANEALAGFQKALLKEVLSQYQEKLQRAGLLSTHQGPSSEKCP
ncbi:MAG: glycosyltransferase [Myxococcota bacterium]|nr:glycosyltransferase [Myxococcota bacterium]